jgi:[protein-PII] uridylyltransferase
MTSGPTFRETLLAARRRLNEGREQIRAQHQSGSPGIQVCARLTDLLDAVVVETYEGALLELPAERRAALRAAVTLVAHGGFGRRDVAPYSDVDLMILHDPGAPAELGHLAGRLLRDLYDVGLAVGQSVRTVDQACQWSLKDATVFTSLAESRFLAGNERLFAVFHERFRKLARARSAQLFQAIDQARREERAQFGETIYLLEPNLKRSRGGLRELQLLRWIGLACHGSPEPDDLQLLGALSKDDVQTLRAAGEFLLRLRNEMHFHAGKSHDVLHRVEQVRLAQVYGYQGTQALLPVEQFMRDYFRHTAAVRSIVSGFVLAARPGQRWQRMLGNLFGRQLEGDFLVTPRQIVATARGLEKIRGDLSEVLRLTDLANLSNKRIGPSTWEAVRAAVPHFDDQISTSTVSRFLSLLSQPARLGELLRRLLELGVLEKIVPAFGHARCLLQFNEYHKYTVDEHSILAVERATEFRDDTGPLGRVYRELKHKRTLHLALLIHDLGKGYVQDHCEVGAEIAAATAARLQLPPREAETLRFLVHKHLLMAHLAFRRDTSDDNLVVRFAVEVGSPETLDLLYLLTAADVAAVGPGVWTDWKAEVLTDLYERAMQHLAGDGAATRTADRLMQRRAAVRQALGRAQPAEWFERQLEALPQAYLYGSPPQRIAAELVELASLQPGEVRAAGRFLPDSRTVEYVVGTHEDVAPGIFHRLTGALAAQGLQILSAQIHTLAEGLVLDRFYVVDPDFADEPPPQRLEAVSQALADALRAPPGHVPTFRKLWQTDAQRERSELNRLPTRVRADNNTSDRYTILDIFTHDRRGLLYTITRTLYELGLSVALAKIGTYLDQVVDVFYVTDQEGRKIHDEQLLEQITTRLLAALAATEPSPAAAP